MLKNKIIVRKIRNIMILFMILIIMLGAYSNIRKSKAENVIEIVLEAIDKDEILEPQIMTIEAKEDEDGKYIFDLPKTVNNFIISKYYLDAENEIVENEIAKDLNAENATSEIVESSNAENATSEIVESSNAENATNEMAESANAKNEASDVTEVDMNNAGTSKTIKLTSEEITSKSVQLTISYDKKEATKLDGTETTVLYNKELKSLGDENGNGEGEVIVTGYMPADAKLEIKDIDLAKLTSVKLESENQTLQKAYEISVFQEIEVKKEETEQEKTTKEETTEAEKETTQEETAQTEKETAKEKTTEKDTTQAEKETTQEEKQQAEENLIAPQALQAESDKAKSVATQAVTDESVPVNDSEETDENATTQSATIQSETTQNTTTQSATAQEETETTKETEKETTTEKVEYNPSEYGETLTIKTKNTQENTVGTIYNLPENLDTIKNTNTEDMTQETEVENIEEQEYVSFTTEKTEETVKYTLATEPMAVDETTLTVGVSSPTETEGEVVTDGLLRYYDARKNTGTGFSSSTTSWTDLSNHEYGILNGGTWSSDGYLTLDGTDDWVNLGQVSLSSAATLEVTVTPVTVTASKKILGNENSGGCGIFITSQTVFAVEFYLGGTWVPCASTVTPETGKTYKISGTYDGSNIKIYINGKLNNTVAASGTIGTPTNNTVMAIGCNSNGSTSSDGQFVNAKIHTARVYNKALTQAQIQNNITVDNSSEPVYIPEGYTHVEGTLDTGYVIEDSNGNQFVWVEVPQTTTVYPTAGLSITEFTDAEFTKIENDLHTYTTTYRKSTSFADTWYSEDATGLTEEEYNTQKKKMLKSIYMYGGFYVGRYETGTTTGRTSASTLTTPVIKQNMYPYNYITNIQAQELSENFSSTGYIGSLMYGVQWDLILKYLETKGAATQAELITNSGSWGNFYDSSWSVTNTSSKYWTSGNGWTSGAYGSKSASTRVVLSTGATDSFKKMNIYDLAGNVWEMTLEYTASASKPVAIRGGGDWSDGDDCPVYYRGKGYTDGDQNANIRI